MANPNRAQEIAQAAILLPSQDIRAHFLDLICGDDDDLRRQVNDRLARVEGATTKSQPVWGIQNTKITQVSANKTQAQQDLPVDTVARERMGTIIGGRYTLVTQLGQGGMGTVWLAEQTSPILRRVAIKLILPDLVSNRVLSRFEAERQALALMDHPNIARVFDAGATLNGRPFFAMELVEGTNLTEFCDARKLSIPERIDLFLQVCRAIQHAHQKGIIHRDLKPSNILVTSTDGAPVPKVIDFGLAKAIGTGILGDSSKSSTLGRIVGTPLYMSPEQASGAYPVDTRTDIYSLGVVLYELLCGTPPIDPNLLKNQNNRFEDVIRLVCQDMPPLPSERAMLAFQQSQIAQRRQATASQLRQQLQGELDVIVMKALQKDPNQRYASIAEFAAELERFRNHEAVLLLSDSRWYRWKKYTRRNRAMVLGSLVALLALVASVTVSTWALWQALQARDAAVNQSQQTLQEVQVLRQELEQLRRGGNP